MTTSKQRKQMRRAGRKGASDRPKVGGSKQHKVVPLNAQQGLKLTDDERLRMENLTLKVALIQSQAKEQSTPLLAQREAVGKAIGDRLGIEIGAYNIDLDKGTVTPQNGGPADPAIIGAGLPALEGEPVDTPEGDSTDEPGDEPDGDEGAPDDGPAGDPDDSDEGPVEPDPTGPPEGESATIKRAFATVDPEG